MVTLSSCLPSYSWCQHLVKEEHEEMWEELQGVVLTVWCFRWLAVLQVEKGGTASVMWG